MVIVIIMSTNAANVDVDVHAFVAVALLVAMTKEVIIRLCLCE
jgi:hypothetical protein